MFNPAPSFKMAYYGRKRPREDYDGERNLPCLLKTQLKVITEYLKVYIQVSRLKTVLNMLNKGLMPVAYVTTGHIFTNY